MLVSDRIRREADPAGQALIAEEECARQRARGACTGVPIGGFYCQSCDTFARVIAISLGLAVYVEAPVVRIKDEPLEDEPGYLIRLERTRPPVPGENRSPLSAGCFFPYAAGQTAETVDYGEALFAWFLVRHAEIVAYFERQDADPSEAVPNPNQPAT